jgi:hypothetical protein
MGNLCLISSCKYYIAVLTDNQSGIGTYDEPLKGNPFGLYRPGPELRGVYVAHPSRARKVCKWWNAQTGEGGCDNAILLG